MKWMPKINKEIEKIEEELELKQVEPVSVKNIEDAIELINVADKIKACFKVTFYLTIGEFYIDSDSFKSIKLMKKTKTEKDRIIVNHYTALLSTETTINIENIYGFTVDVAYMNKWVDEDDNKE